MKYITQHERQKAMFLQEQAQERMIKWGVLFTASYFLIRIIMGI